jgi:uncharacterized protein DUF6766
MYVVLTAFLYQRGSSESKPIDSSAPQDEDPRDVTPKEGTPWRVRRGGWVLVLYEHSLAIAELAERIHRGRSDSGVINLCAAERLCGIKAGCRTAPTYQRLSMAMAWPTIRKQPQRQAVTARSDDHRIQVGVDVAGTGQRLRSEFGARARRSQSGRYRSRTDALSPADRPGSRR